MTQVGARLREQLRRGTFGVHVLAVLTGLMGVINVLSAATPSLAWRLRVLRQYVPLEVRHGGHLATALAGFALLLLAGSLWRRKRVAWMLTIAVLVLSAWVMTIWAFFSWPDIFLEISGAGETLACGKVSHSPESLIKQLVRPVEVLSMPISGRTIFTSDNLNSR